MRTNLSSGTLSLSWLWIDPARDDCDIAVIYTKSTENEEQETW